MLSSLTKLSLYMYTKCFYYLMANASCIYKEARCMAEQSEAVLYSPKSNRLLRYYCVTYACYIRSYRYKGI